jgi:hypothetical protein
LLLVYILPQLVAPLRFLEVPSVQAELQPEARIQGSPAARSKLGKRQGQTLPAAEAEQFE